MSATELPPEIWAGRTTDPDNPTIWHDEPGVWPEARRYVDHALVAPIIEAVEKWDAAVLVFSKEQTAESAMVLRAASQNLSEALAAYKSTMEGADER